MRDRREVVRSTPSRRQVFDLLFQCAAQTLLTLGRDPKRLGADIGVTAVLHTWSRDLSFHPHLQCIVTGGGLSLDGSRWVEGRRGGSRARPQGELQLRPRPRTRDGVTSTPSAPGENGRLMPRAGRYSRASRPSSSSTQGAEAEYASVPAMGRLGASVS
ncbi:transposase [Sorangium sp. So ce321]